MNPPKFGPIICVVVCVKRENKPKNLMSKMNYLGVVDLIRQPLYFIIVMPRNSP